jgi:outer membrane receptor for ferrienterochelin and colicins
MQTKIRMKSIRKIVYALCISMCVSLCANAQDFSIKGIVKDAKTGQILKGASIKIHGTTIGCMTNENGRFILENINGDIILKASFAGYASERSYLKVDKNITELIFALNKSQINLDEVTITGTGSHYKLRNSPVQVELITKKTIENVGITNFENLLTTLSPSFDFSLTQGMGTVANINGLGSKYITFMVNGRKMTGDVSGNIDLSRINTENIERIEIVKGASSSLYGSDAIGGVVNIITKKSHDKFKITSNTQTGGNGMVSENATLDINTKNFHSNTNFNYKKTDWYSLTPEYKDAKDYYIYGTDSKNISQNFEITPTDALSINIGGNYYRKKMFTPKEKPRSKYDYNYEGKNLLAGAKYLFNKSNYIKFDISKDDYKQEKVYFKDYKSFKKGDIQFNKQQKTTTAHLKGVFKLGGNHTVVTGIEHKIDNLKASMAKIPDGDKDAYTTSIYAQDVFKPIENLSLVIGARGIKHQTFGSELTPKISAMYKLSDFNLRATYSHGFKTPTLQELYYEYWTSTGVSVGNENLKPEKSKYYNLSIEYIKSWLNASISVYRNDITDMISKKIVGEEDVTLRVDQAVEDRKIYLYSNISKARTQGVDFSFNSYIGSGFNLGGGYSYVDAKNLSTNKRLIKTSKNYANIRLSWDKNWTAYSLNVTLTGKYQDGKYYSYKSKEGTTPDFNTWRLSTNHKFYSTKGLKLSIMGGIDNIFDYVETDPFEYKKGGYYYGTLTPGRTFFVGIKFEFTK